MENKTKEPLSLLHILKDVAAGKITPEAVDQMLSPLLVELYARRDAAHEIENLAAQKEKDISSIGYSTFTEDDAKILRRVRIA